MSERRWKIARLLIAIVVAVASLPLSQFTVDINFGLGSLLIVPAFAVSAWFLLTAREELRAWWFGFVITNGMFLPLCPWVEQGLHSVAVYLQHLTQSGILSLSQRVIEPTLLILVVLCPLVLASLLGFAAGRFTQRLARGATRREATVSPDGGHWRFSIREMLIAIAAVCFLAAWNSGHTRHWKDAEDRNQSAFLNRFKASFSSGEVGLLAEPRIEEQQRTRMREFGPLSFRAPGINEYRIVAPVKMKEQELWAVWVFTSRKNNEHADEYVYKFAYAEAPNEEQLPDFPFPAQRYIEGTWDMVDGLPATSGPSATVTLVTSRADQPIVLTASAPPGTVCELYFFPAYSLPTLPPQTPNKNGNVSWSWNISPGSAAGYGFRYELKCIQHRGAAQLSNSTWGNIEIVAARPTQ
jgi:hypothetical protein